MYQLKAVSFWASCIFCLCICTTPICHFTAASSMLYLYQIWTASREGYAASLRTTKISFMSSCTWAWTHRTESNKYVFWWISAIEQSLEFCLLPVLMYSVIWQKKKNNSGFISIQLWPLWTYNAFCMFKLIMHFYFRLRKHVLSQWFPKKKKNSLPHGCL